MTFNKIKMLGLAAAMLPACIGLTISSTAGELQTLPVGNFSAAQPGDNLPAGWEEIKFDRASAATRYSLVDDDGKIVVKAESRASASGLYCAVTVNPRQYPIVTWRWKVSRTLPDEDLTLKSGDDYPARLYIMFGHDGREQSFFEKTRRKAAQLFYGRELPATSLVYIWSGRAPLETTVASPYSSEAMMIVVDSGDRLVGNWIEKKRNILDDYQRAYGRPAPRIIGVALMTDTDNTAARAESYYGDIIFQSLP